MFKNRKRVIILLWTLRTYVLVNWFRDSIIIYSILLSVEIIFYLAMPVKCFFFFHLALSNWGALVGVKKLLTGSVCFSKCKNDQILFGQTITIHSIYLWQWLIIDFHFYSEPLLYFFVQQPREKGRMRFHKLQNVQIALDFLKHRQVQESLHS